MGAKHGRGNDKGPKKIHEQVLLGNYLVYITSNKELCSHAQV
jgi:hypothetical protein